MSFSDDLVAGMALSAAQVNQESGGHQMDPKDPSKPLTSKKGAIGIAQVMPNTAPEAARYAGLPWDENKYKTDAVYNKALGDAYQAHLDDKYGGRGALSVAAYNAGPGRVDHALAQQAAGKGKWGDHIPGETRDYVRSVLGKDVPMSGGVPSAGFADDIAKGLGLSTPYTTAAPTAGELKTQGDPNATAAGTIDLGSIDPTQTKTDVKSVQTAATAQSDFLNHAVSQVTANSQAVVDSAQKIATVKQSIADDMAARSKVLDARMQGFNTRRTALLDRLDEVGRMNPLERMMKATFNPDYDTDVLRGRLDKVNELIKGHEAIYTDENARQATVASAVVDATDAVGRVAAAKTAGVNADAQMLGMVLGSANAKVSSDLLPSQAEAEALRADQQVRGSILGKMSEELATNLYHQAAASPDGTVTVQGTKFTVGELQDTSRKLQGQGMQMRSMQNSLQVGDIQHARALEEDLVNHMTKAQLEEISRNGGSYQGHQFSLPLVTQALASVTANDAFQVDKVVDATAPGMMNNQMDRTATLVDTAVNRATDMFGVVPGELSQLKGQILAGTKLWHDGYVDAKNRGVAPDYVKAHLPELQAFENQGRQVIERLATQWGGGKKELVAVASSFLNGNPISGDDATRGLIILATSGMPAGANITGPAKAAMEAARRVVLQAQGANGVKPGMDLAAIMAGNGKVSQADLMRRVQQAAGAAYSASITEQLFSAMPDIARRVREPGAPGNVSPFARVDRQDFLASVQHGDEMGYGVIASKTGLRPDDVKQMFAQGSGGAIWQDYAKKKGLQGDEIDSQFQSLGGLMAATQRSSMLAALDASHSARPGFLPSQAFIQFLQNPQTRNEMDHAVGAFNKSSFGSFVTSSAAGGGYRDELDGYVNQLVGTQMAVHSKDLAQRITQQRNIGGDPFVRTGMVLGATGFTKGESDLLLSAVKPLVKLPEKGIMDYGLLDLVRPGDNLNARPSFNRSQYDAVTEIIKNHKFDNPHVEALRKRAASSWDSVSDTVGKAVSTLGN